MRRPEYDGSCFVVIIFSKSVSTPRAELSGADDVNKRTEGRETQKKNSPRTETRLLGLPPLVDVLGAGKLGSWCGHRLRRFPA